MYSSSTCTSSLPCHMQGTETVRVNKMFYDYLNIYFGTKLLFEQKFSQEECTAYSQLSAFVTNTDLHSILNFKLLLEGVSMNSLLMFL